MLSVRFRSSTNSTFGPQPSQQPPVRVALAGSLSLSLTLSLSLSAGGIVGDLNGLGGNYVLDVAKSIINPSKTKSRSTFSCLEANITAADATGGVRRFGKSLADPAYLLHITYIRYIHRDLHTNSTYKYRICIIRRRYITIAIRRTFVLLPPLDGPDAYTPRPFIP